MRVVMSVVEKHSDMPVKKYVRVQVQVQTAGRIFWRDSINIVVFLLN